MLISSQYNMTTKTNSKPTYFAMILTNVERLQCAWTILEKNTTLNYYVL